MRQCSTLFCALALLFSPFFFAYFEGESLLEWPDGVYRWFDPWLPFVILCSSVITLALPWIVELLAESDETT